jgi:uncharacterized membrane protein
VSEPVRAEAAGPQRDRPCAVLGVIVAPGLVHDVTSKIADELLADLRERYDSVDWRGELEVDRLVEPPAPLTEIFDSARRKLLESDWDLGVVVTDLPLKVGGRPVSRHLSPTHGVAVLSLPALGAIHLRPRLRRALVELIGELAGDEEGSEWEDAVLRELATPTETARGARRLLFVPTVLAGHLRLLLGMVRANRPWRLAARLYGALVAALAVAAFGVVTRDIWLLANSMGWWRLAVLCAVSLAATTLAVIGAHGLWERAPDPRVRDQVVLFNMVTAVTVAIGILALYAALFLLAFGAVGLVARPELLTRTLGHPVGVGEYAAVAWFAASLATVAGGLGAGLESREVVREAAYTTTVGDDRFGTETPG